MEKKKNGIVNVDTKSINANDEKEQNIRDFFESVKIEQERYENRYRSL